MFRLSPSRIYYVSLKRERERERERSRSQWYSRRSVTKTRSVSSSGAARTHQSHTPLVCLRTPTSRLARGVHTHSRRARALARREARRRASPHPARRRPRPRRSAAAAARSRPRRPGDHRDIYISERRPRLPETRRVRRKSADLSEAAALKGTVALLERAPRGPREKFARLVRAHLSSISIIRSGHTIGQRSKVLKRSREREMVHQTRRSPRRALKIQRASCRYAARARRRRARPRPRGCAEFRM